MLRADLYERAIRFERYLTQSDCRACGFSSREEFLEKLKKGEVGHSCSARLGARRLAALRIAAVPESVISPIEVSQLPDPGPAGLFQLNDPGPASPVLVSGNSRLTIEVLSAVLSTTTSPFWYLIVDTGGHTVDMALIFETLTPERISEALAAHSLKRSHTARRMVIPGLAAHLREETAGATGWEVEVGPICAAELPLYFGPSWELRLAP
jgi:CO dehydrogenase/acetyl-CoA synthase gamma subunit (corrinoid Fe-S protein)